MPSDLYIPPEALSVFLDAFEGRWTSLLYLIRRHSLDHPRHPHGGAHAPVHGIRRDDGARSQLELAAEYLLMAALLIEIKSRMLLPRPSGAREEDEGPDPRAELVSPPPRVRADEARRDDAGGRAGRRPRTSSVVEVYVEQAMARAPAGHRGGGLFGGLALDPRPGEDDEAPQDHARSSCPCARTLSRILRTLSGGAFTEFSLLFEPEHGCPSWW